MVWWLCCFSPLARGQIVNAALRPLRTLAERPRARYVYCHGQAGHTELIK